MSFNTVVIKLTSPSLSHHTHTQKSEYFFSPSPLMYSLIECYAKYFRYSTTSLLRCSKFSNLPRPQPMKNIALIDL